MAKMSVILAVTAVSSTYFWGANGIWLTAVLALALGGWFSYKQTARVRVGELEVGVLYKSKGKTFVRFLPPGKHWLRPFKEQMLDKIPTTTATVNGQSVGVSTSGGLSLTIDWTVQYGINPFRIPAAAQPSLARALPRKAGLIAKNHLDNCLRHVISEYSIDQLCQPGVQKRLERAIRQTTAERLAGLGFELSRVMLGTIEMPVHVRAALEAAHEHHVQTEYEVKALERLHQVVTQFSESDMQRLMELERIQKLGRNGVTLVYPTNGTLGGDYPARESASNAKNSYTRLAAKRAVVAPSVS